MSLLKSLRIGKFRLFFSTNALFVQGSLTSMPTIWALNLLNSERLSLSAHISLVQTLVKAPGKNASSVAPLGRDCFLGFFFFCCLCLCGGLSEGRVCFCHWLSQGRFLCPSFS